MRLTVNGAIVKGWIYKDGLKPIAETVSGHSKPASDGHLKTSHLDEAVQPVECIPKGDRFCDGEPDQDGYECFDHRTVRARLVPAAYRA